MARQLLKKIDSVRRRAVLLVWIRSVCLALALTVLIGLLFLLLDGLLRSDSIGLRLFCLAGSFAAGIFAFAKWILPALNYRPRRVDIARRIEEASPDWKNELTTSVELASKPGDASNDLEYQLIDRTWHRLKQTPRSSFTNLQSIIGPASILAMVAAIGGLVFAAQKTTVLHSLKRIAMPWSQADWPRRNALTFSDMPTQIARGESLTIHAFDRNDLLDGGLRAEYQTGSKSALIDLSADNTTAATGQPRRFSGVIRDVQDNILIRVTGGDDQTDWHEIKVVDLPDLISYELRTSHPLVESGEWQLVTEDLNIWPGTQLRVSGSANMDLNQAALVFEIGDQKFREPLEVSDGRIFRSPAPTKIPEQTSDGGRCWIELTSVQDTSSERLTVRSIRLLQDQAPTVTVTTDDKIVGPNSVIRVRTTLLDDMPISEPGIQTDTELLLYQNRRSPDQLVTRQPLQMKPMEQGSTEQPFAAESETVIDMKIQEGWNVGDQMLITAVARDRMANESTAITAVQIVSNEQLLEKATQRTRKLARTVDELQTQQTILKERTSRLIDSESSAGHAAQLKQVVINQRSVLRLFASGPQSSVGINQSLLDFAERHRLEWPGLEPLQRVREIQQAGSRRIITALEHQLSTIDGSLELFPPENSSAIDLSLLDPLQTELLDLFNQTAQLVKVTAGFEELSLRVVRLRDQQAKLIEDTVTLRQMALENPGRNIDREASDLTTEQTRIRTVTEKFLGQLAELIQTTGVSQSQLQSLVDAQAAADSGSLITRMLSAESSLAARQPGRAIDAQRQSFTTLETMVTTLVGDGAAQAKGLASGLARQIQEATRQLEQLNREIDDLATTEPDRQQTARQQIDDKKVGLQNQLSEIKSALQSSPFANLEGLIQNAMDSVAESSSDVAKNDIASESLEIQQAINQLQQISLAIAEQSQTDPNESTDLKQVLEFLLQIQQAQQGINVWTSSQLESTGETETPATELLETQQQVVALQGQVANAFGIVSENLKQYPTASIITRSIKGTLEDVTKRMSELSFDLEMLRQQQKIVVEMKILVDAIKIQLEAGNETPEVDSNDQDEEQSQESVGISSFELTMLYVVQQNLLRESEALALQLREAGSESEELKAVRLELGKRQAEIAEVLSNLLDQQPSEKAIPSLPDF